MSWGGESELLATLIDMKSVVSLLLETGGRAFVLDTYLQRIIKGSGIL